MLRYSGIFQRLSRVFMLSVLCEFFPPHGDNIYTHATAATAATAAVKTRTRYRRAYQVERTAQDVEKISHDANSRERPTQPRRSHTRTHTHERERVRAYPTAYLLILCASASDTHHAPAAAPAYIGCACVRVFIFFFRFYYARRYCAWALQHSRRRRRRCRCLCTTRHWTREFGCTLTHTHTDWVSGSGIWCLLINRRPLPRACLFSYLRSCIDISWGGRLNYCLPKLIIQLFSGCRRERCAMRKSIESRRSIIVSKTTTTSPAS